MKNSLLVSFVFLAACGSGVQNVSAAKSVPAQAQVVSSDLLVGRVFDSQFFHEELTFKAGGVVVSDISGEGTYKIGDQDRSATLTFANRELIPLTIFGGGDELIWNVEESAPRAVYNQVNL